MRLLLATRNVKKLAELRRILADQPDVELVGLDDVGPYPETPETELTFAGNALLKARDGAVHSGLPCAADDSGLAVDALNGMPGTLSARWAGSHGDDVANLRLLLDQISDIADEQRGAAFISAVALVYPDGTEHVVHGEARGRIVRQPRGEEGFGYDPIFVADGFDRTNAQLTPAEKDAISHRGQALRELAQLL